MTRVSKIFVATLLVAMTGGGIRQAVKIQGQAARLADAKQLADQWRHKVFKLQAERAAALAQEAAAKLALVDVPETGSADPAFDAELRSLFEKVGRLREYLAQHPREQIPQLRFLNDTAWFEVVQWRETLTGDADFKSAMTSLRSDARSSFSILMASAIKDYVKTSGGRLPEEITDLAPFFVVPVDAALLQRYETRATGLAADVPRGAPVVGEKPDDELNDHLLEFPLNSYGGRPPAPEKLFLAVQFYAPSSLQNATSKAIQAYRVANHGREPNEAQQVLPYFQNAGDGERFLRLQEQVQVQAGDTPGSFHIMRKPAPDAPSR